MRLCLACWSVRHTTLFHQMTFIVQFVSCGPIGRPAGITSSAAQTCSVREQGTRCLQMQILLPTLDVCDHMRALSCGFQLRMLSRVETLPRTVSKVLLTYIRLSVYVRRGLI